MPRWMIENPEKLTFDQVHALSVRIVAGRLAVLASDGPPSLEVSDVGSPPLVVTHDDDGKLMVTYKDLTWEGALGWLRNGLPATTLTLTVPKDCPVQARVISASAVVAGFENRTRVKSVSGEVVLDGVSGDVRAETISGALESRGLTGDLTFTSVSGELTVADGSPRRLKANTVSGRITADLQLTPTGHVTLISISGAIMVRLPAVVDTDVALRSTSGRVKTSFDGLNGNNHPGARSVTGRLGGGMATLSASTVSGDVTLLRGEDSA